MAMTGKNRIMIYGPKDDGTYIVEFRTSAGEALCVRPSLIKQSGGQPRGVSPINGFYVISPEMLD
jgi:hypothetical protein